VCPLFQTPHLPTRPIVLFRPAPFLSPQVCRHSLHNIAAPSPVSNFVSLCTTLTGIQFLLRLSTTPFFLPHAPDSSTFCDRTTARTQIFPAKTLASTFLYRTPIPQIIDRPCPESLSLSPLFSCHYNASVPRLTVYARPPSRADVTYGLGLWVKLFFSFLVGCDIRNTPTMQLSY